MPYPWASFSGFFFHREETAIYGTDIGWVKTPSYSRQRPLGTATDVITTLSIGSAERTFELHLTPARYTALESLLNSQGLFTDWTRPTPDSRQAFLAEVSPLGDVISYSKDGTAIRKRHARVTLVTL